MQRDHESSLTMRIPKKRTVIDPASLTSAHQAATAFVQARSRFLLIKLTPLGARPSASQLDRGTCFDRVAGDRVVA